MAVVAVLPVLRYCSSSHLALVLYSPTYGMYLSDGQHGVFEQQLILHLGLSLASSIVSGTINAIANEPWAQMETPLILLPCHDPNGEDERRSS